MAQTTAEFFDRLAERGHDPLLERVTGSVRFDLKDNGRTQRWRVDIKKGDIEVSRANSAADCVVKADRAILDDLVSGRANPFAAMLRGTVQLEGDTELVVLFQRVLREEPA